MFKGDPGHIRGLTAVPFEAVTLGNNHVFDYDSTQAVVRRLVQLEWEGRPLDTPERNVDTIGHLTVEDVRKVAEEYLHPDGLAILVVGNADDFEQPLSTFGDVIEIELE